MQFLKSRRGNKLLNRYVFRKRVPRKSKSAIRLFLESIIMLLSGVWLLLFLNTLPRNYDLGALLNQASLDLAIGFFKIIDGFSLLGVIFLLGLLIILGLVLLLGSIWRLLKVASYFFSKSDKLKINSNR